MPNPSPPTQVVVLAPGSSIGTSPAAATAPAALTYPANGVFQGQGVWMLGPAVTVPAGAKRVSFNPTYTGNGAGAQVQFRLRFGHATNKMGIEPIDDSNIAAAGSTGTQLEFDRVRARPVSDAVPMTWPVEADVGDEPFVALDFAETMQGVGGAGSISVTWEASFT